jgi:hypothetical protein
MLFSLSSYSFSISMLMQRKPSWLRSFFNSDLNLLASAPSGDVSLNK